MQRGQRPHHRRGARFHPQLLVDVLQVLVHRPRADREQLRRGRGRRKHAHVAVVGRQPPQDVQLDSQVVRRDTQPRLRAASM